MRFYIANMALAYLLFAVLPDGFVNFFDWHLWVVLVAAAALNISGYIEGRTQ
jgi:hypothetical protein